MFERTLVVAGRFDDTGGRPSGYAKKLFGRLNNIEYLNGGKFDTLQHIDFRDFNVIFWLPDVPNDKEKTVNQIKVINPKCLLVTSKNNIDNKYKPLELVSRALSSKSNLLMEFGKTGEKIHCTIWDPIGNVYAYKEHDIDNVAWELNNRLTFLKSMTRIGSQNIVSNSIPEVPNETDFFEIASKFAVQFHDLVHAVNTDRFVGNLSFRCAMGNLSFRSQKLLCISKRNIDKREIDRNGFVVVDGDCINPVRYYGSHKPSVDAPIQVALYRHMPKINYMIHSHVYISGADSTEHIIPCGAIEEVAEITKIVQPDSKKFAINLDGHGSLVGGATLSAFRNINFIPRPIPEFHS